MSIRSLLRNLFGRNRSAEPPQDPESRATQTVAPAETDAADTAAETDTAVEPDTAVAEKREDVGETAERVAPEEKAERFENVANSAHETDTVHAHHSAGRTETERTESGGGSAGTTGSTLTTQSAEPADDSGRVPTPRSAADSLSESGAADRETSTEGEATEATWEGADSSSAVEASTVTSDVKVTSEADREDSATTWSSAKTTSEDFLDSVASTTHEEYPPPRVEAPAEPTAPEPNVAAPEAEAEALPDDVPEAPVLGDERPTASTQEPTPAEDLVTESQVGRQPSPEPGEPARVAAVAAVTEPTEPTEPTEATTAATSEASPNATAAVSLEKVEATAPGLVSLYKAAGVSLEKRGLAGQRAAVYLVLDRSGSMRRYYKDGTVQHLAEQALGLSAHLDDDGTVPVVFFSTDIDGSADIELSNYGGRIAELHAEYGHMGRTNYHRAIEAVVEHYERSGATDPALVIFQTDGAPTSRAAAEKALCEAADKPLFWQFIGFGDPKSAGLNFLRKLDSGLPVPEKRVVDNAGFFHAGIEPLKLSDSELYEALTEEFPEWLAAIRDAKIHP